MSILERTSVSEICNRIANWIEKKVEEANARGGVFGLSGGIDSAVVAGLCTKKLGPERTLGLIMPCYSDPSDIQLAKEAAKSFGIPTRTVSLEPIYDKFKEILPSGNKIAEANLKPRMRMITLYYFANNLNYLVIGTGNRSEITVGYFTKYGDGGVDILPLGGFLKTEVREIARYLKVPENIINRAPSAGLWAGQTDEGEIGMSYEELDKAILYIEEGKKLEVSPEILDKVGHLIQSNSHKREPPSVFKT